MYFFSFSSDSFKAPEVFTTHKYDSKADLWSVGCILYEMVVGRVPFIAQSQVALFQLINSQPVTFPKEVSLTDTCRVPFPPVHHLVHFFFLQKEAEQEKNTQQKKVQKQ